MTKRDHALTSLKRSQEYSQRDANALKNARQAQKDVEKALMGIEKAIAAIKG